MRENLLIYLKEIWLTNRNAVPMFNRWRLSEILANNPSPLRKCFALTETNSVVLKCFPMNKEWIHVGLFNSFMHFEVNESFWFGENFCHSTFYSSFKLRMIFRWNFHEYGFKNHRFIIKKIRPISRTNRKSPDFSGLFHADLVQLFWPLPIGRVESVKTVVETTGFEPALRVW